MATSSTGASTGYGRERTESPVPHGAPAGGPRARSIRYYRYKEYLTFALFVAPNLAIIIVFNYWPVIQNFYLSLTSWDLVALRPTFVGLSNYADLLADPEFARIMLNSLIYAGAIVIGTLVIGLAIALLFNQRLAGAGAARTIAFAPHIITGAAIATLWSFIFDPNYGLSKVVLNGLGIPSPDWTGDPTWSLWSLIVVQLWRGVGFAAILYLAGLQSLPAELYEAAKLDGAGYWTRLRKLTVPLLSPITFFILIITTLHSFRAYEVTAILTDGGPGLSSTTLTWYIYKEAFSSHDIGHATAAGVVLFVILVAMTFVQTRFIGRRVHYQ